VAGKTTGGDATDLFRMPVDRSFSVAGAGTVVTGTTWSGTATVGDEVAVLPGGEKARIRSIEVHDRPADQAVPGRRTAIALVGVDRESVGRGSFVVHHKYWTPSRRVDAFVTLLPGARPLTQRSRIRVHIGTAEIMARITPATDDIPPGGSGMVRLRLDEPLVCRWGDRGVLRAYSPMITVGGCVVVDPFPDPRPRRPSSDPSLRSDQPAERLSAFVSDRGAITTSELPVRIGVHPDLGETVLAEVTQLGVQRSGDTLMSESSAEAAWNAALVAVSDFHETDPLKPGLPLEAFRKAAGGGPKADYSREKLESDRLIVVEKGSVRLKEHAATLVGANETLANGLLAQLEKAGAEGVNFADLSDGLAEDRAHFTEVAEYLVRRGGVLRIGSDRYYWENGLREATEVALKKIGESGATPADLREVLGLSRKYLIPLLEWMDGQGITTRDGDVRRMGPKAKNWV
jgi:selenocysteine-specific elongation factor